jgi:microcystin-dependent protein
MSEPFVGQITQVAFTFAPRDYAWCDGQLLAINQNAALYSLIGTQFGGDGRVNFNLPDLRGRVPIHPGNDIQKQGLSCGSEQVTLTTSTMPAHTHGFVGTTSDGDSPLPNPTATKILSNAELSGAAVEPQPIYGQLTNLIQLNSSTMTSTGGGGSHDNLQPSLVIGFIIALAGYYPSRD